jgi:hypothetical protein
MEKDIINSITYEELESLIRCFIKHHAKKTYRGVKVQLHFGTR